eukprot:CAMPEP_0117606372 /NCGR_PEP_ID=MMETSP0784-20121206/79678_1 /TAXON_ID=39447 /ORGANISM="" /LENGTH=315 /DNA_ID=CAMNT_0005409451 /DNA_START=36 /DNA_END=980 /DNA_ORIENTATION=-
MPMVATIATPTVAAVHRGRYWTKHYAASPSTTRLSFLTRPVALRVIVLTCNRASSLRRLLESLTHADYFGDRVDIDIWVDKEEGKPLNAPTMDVASRLTWTAGAHKVHLRQENAGLKAQWTETWCGLTGHTSERAVILEDDLEVSPHYWRWLKACHAAYEGRSDFSGCTLQRLNLCAKRCPDLKGGPQQATMNFMYPLVGSWGYSPSAAHWVRFTTWLRKFVRSRQKPYVPGLTPTDWYMNFEKEGRCPGKRCMWTMYHIRYCNEFADKYTVYIRLPDGSTLATNYKEAGLHFSDKKATARRDAKRLLEWDAKFG